MSDILFILHDAGETFALKPVISELETKHVSYKIVAFSTAYEILKNQNYVSLVNESDFEKIISDNNAKVVVTGMASHSQLQLATYYKKNGTRVFGFFDGLFLMEADSIGAKFLPYLTDVMVPSFNIGQSIKKINSSVEVEVVGQPTLEEWKYQAKIVNRKDIIFKLGLVPAKKTLVYAGAYGEVYEKAFPLFAKAAQELTSDYNIVLALHPKVSGDFERKILAEMRIKDVIIAPPDLPTKNIAFIADVVSVHQSTVGFQSVFMGKPVIYLDVPEAQVANLAVSYGWAYEARSVDDFKSLVKKLMSQSHLNRDLFKQAGIPIQSVQIISKLIQSKLVSNRNSVRSCMELMLN